jgi:hypothetical protein
MNFDRLNTACRRAFGETVEIVWLDSDRTANGIYDSRHFADPQPREGQPASILLTTLAVVDAEAGEVSTGERLIARNVQYRVKDTRPDGQGMTWLDLELDAAEEGES